MKKKNQHVVGIIGLGMLGTAIAKRLLSNGIQVNVFVRDKSKLNKLQLSGVEIFDKVSLLGNECDFVISCVTDFKSLMEVFFGQNGLSESSNSDLIVADFSTVKADQSIYCSNMLMKRGGINFLSAPVMGGPTDAKNGELVIMVSGKKDIFDQFSIIFDCLSSNVFYIGDSIGNANLIKLSLNLNIAIISLGLSEGIILAKNCGIDPNLYLKVFNLTKFKTGISENKGYKMLNHDFSPSFFLKNMKKDIDLIMETSQSKQLFLPLTSISQQLFTAASRKSDLREKDYSAIFQFLDEMNT